MPEALVIIDIQKDYFPGGNMEVVNSEAAAKMANLLLTKFRKEKKVIIHIQHISTREGATFFLPETKGVEIHESVSPVESEKIITKNFPNSFRNTDLENHLRDNGVKKIIFCGMMSHMCIDATVRAAYDKGFTCIVAEDACATRNLSYGGIEVSNSNVHASFMAALSAVYAKVTTADEIIKETTL
ncbi:cysteine hydrolase family protein [Thermodesulfobacteriota bacterium B35]